jgi:hypothetical protein
VDADLAGELRADETYELSAVRVRRAHGLGLVQPYVLRRH